MATSATAPCPAALRQSTLRTRCDRSFCSGSWEQPHLPGGPEPESVRGSASARELTIAAVRTSCPVVRSGRARLARFWRFPRAEGGPPPFRRAGSRMGHLAVDRTERGGHCARSFPEEGLSGSAPGGIPANLCDTPGGFRRRSAIRPGAQLSDSPRGSMPRDSGAPHQRGHNRADRTPGHSLRRRPGRCSGAF